MMRKTARTRTTTIIATVSFCLTIVWDSTEGSGIFSAFFFERSRVEACNCTLWRFQVIRLGFEDRKVFNSLEVLQGTCIDFYRTPTTLQAVDARAGRRSYLYISRWDPTHTHLPLEEKEDSSRPRYA